MVIAAALLLLADPRLPAGGHAHSGCVEPAVAAGLVRDDESLRAFLAGRLATSGLVSAAFAAAACLECARPAPRWALLDRELDARTPSPAQRAASRAQGRGLLRAAAAAWPSPRWDELRTGVNGPFTPFYWCDGPFTPTTPGRPATPGAPATSGAPATAGGPATPVDPHHAVVLGACTWVAGGTPHDAATLAAMAAVTGPASAAVRLLGLDPLAVHAVLAGLAEQVDAVSAAAAAADATGPAAAAGADATGPAGLPSSSAPAMEVLAELHRHQEVGLFES